MSNKITAITLTTTNADAIDNALYVLENLFEAVPGDAYMDLHILADAIAALKIVNNKIVDDNDISGFLKLYQLERR